MTTPLAI